MTDAPKPANARRRDLVVAGACGAFVGLMVAASYAAVPLYDWFCRVTGFGGTTQVATSAPSEISDRIITVRFDSNVGADLPWTVTPAAPITGKIGTVETVNFVAKNLSDKPITGQAIFNVVPEQTGI